MEIQGEGKLIFKLVKSEGKVHNLTRDNEELRKQVKNLESYIKELESKIYITL